MSLVRARSVSLDRVRCSLLHGLLSAVAPSKPQRIADAAWATPIPPAALRTDMKPHWVAGSISSRKLGKVCRRAIDSAWAKPWRARARLAEAATGAHAEAETNTRRGRGGQSATKLAIPHAPMRERANQTVRPPASASLVACATKSKPAAAIRLSYSLAAKLAW